MKNNRQCELFVEIKKAPFGEPFPVSVISAPDRSGWDLLSPSGRR